METKGRIQTFFGTVIIFLILSFYPSFIIFSHIFVSYHRFYNRTIQIEMNLFIYSLFIIAVNSSVFIVNKILKKKISIVLVLLVTNILQIFVWLIYYFFSIFSIYYLFFLIIVIGLCYGINISYSIKNLLNYSEDKNDYLPNILLGFISCLTSLIFSIFILYFSKLILLFSDKEKAENVLDRYFFPYYYTSFIKDYSFYFVFVLIGLTLISFIIHNTNKDGIEDNEFEELLSGNFSENFSNEDEEKKKIKDYGRTNLIVLVPLLSFPVFYKPLVTGQEKLTEKIFKGNFKIAYESKRFFLIFFFSMLLNFSEEILFNTFIIRVIHAHLNIIYIYCFISGISFIIGIIYLLIIKKKEKLSFRNLLFIKVIFSITLSILVLKNFYFHYIFIVLIGILFVLNQEIIYMHLTEVFTEDYSAYLFQMCSTSKGISSLLGTIILYFMCKSYLIDKSDAYNFIYYCSIGTNILSLLISFLESKKKFDYSKNVIKTE